MGCTSNGATPSTQYALVSYLPDPLGLFLDRLRLEMDSGCKPHAHVTILPPRPITGKQSVAAEELERGARNFVAFEVHLGKIAIFKDSDVIYLGIKAGWDELRHMYQALNHGAVTFQEPYPYHPHITLAQNIDHAQVKPLGEMARQRWAEYRGPRSFWVEELAFVRNNPGCEWIDLANISLPKPVECLAP